MFPITVAMAAPATFQCSQRIMTGSKMMLARFPIIIPIMAVWALPSERMMLLKLLLTIRKGIPSATMFRYWEAYPMVPSLAPTARQMGLANTQMSTMAMMPMVSPVQKQNEEVCFAFCGLPSPSILEIREVPPMPNNSPTAIKSRNTGVAMDTAATI